MKAREVVICRGKALNKRVRPGGGGRQATRYLFRSTRKKTSNHGSNRRLIGKDEGRFIRDEGTILGLSQIGEHGELISRLMVGEPRAGSAGHVGDAMKEKVPRRLPMGGGRAVLVSLSG